MPNPLNQYGFLSSVHANTVKYGGTTSFFNVGTERERTPSVWRYVVGNGLHGFTMDRHRFNSHAGRSEFIDLCGSRIDTWRVSVGADGFGTWIDPETGTVYVDPINVYVDLQTAMNRARENGEKAIFDRWEGLTISTEPK